LKRHAFQIKLGFSYTVHKDQGQSYEYVGIDLTSPVFEHGQLYVALSRAKKSEDMWIKTESGSTTVANIVERAWLGK
ncbi:hypothetical protein M153_2380007707, partial [Pseudoloma neurophilia]